nr:47 kda protein [Quercus suber]
MEDPLNLPDNATILANKKAHPLFARLFRSKGEFWLATRPNRAGEWSQAGAMLTLQGGRPWFCTIERSEWETGVQEIDELVEHDVAQGGLYGDRRQELVFIGEKLDTAGIQAALDECVLSDEEWASWTEIMQRGDGPNSANKDQLASKVEALADLFDDGFPDWAGEDDEQDGEEMEHDHAHGHHHHHAHAHPHAPAPRSTRARTTADAGMAKHRIAREGVVY